MFVYVSFLKLTVVSLTIFSISSTVWFIVKTDKLFSIFFVSDGCTLTIVVCGIGFIGGGNSGSSSGSSTFVDESSGICKNTKIMVNTMRHYVIMSRFNFEYMTCLL